MKKILGFISLFIILFTKIYSADPKPPKDKKILIINVDNKIFKIEPPTIPDYRITSIIAGIENEIKKIKDDELFVYNFTNDDDKEKENLKNLKNSFNKDNYSLERFKKDNGDHYFLEFYKDTVNDYNNINIENINDITEIYLIKKIDPIKNYEIVIENTDIYDEKNVGFTDNVKDMIKTIPFELNKFNHNEILKKVLEQNRKEDYFVIDDDINIEDNKIKLKIKINEGKDDDCYKKINFKLELTTDGAKYEEKANSDVFYKDWKDKIAENSFTFDDIKTIFKEKLKDIYLFEKEKDQITCKEEGGNHVIELKYSNNIKIESIKYISTNEEGNKKEDEKIKDEHDAAKPITVYTDCDKISEFLYKLSSLLHFNIYECYTLYDNSSNKITADGDLSKLSKIEIDQNKLKVKYEVEFNGENKDLYFSNECNSRYVCRLLVDENSLENYKLTTIDKNGKSVEITSKEAIPSKEGNNTIKYKLEKKEEKPEEGDKYDLSKIKLPTEKIKVNEGNKNNNFKTIEEINKYNEEIYKKNEKIAEMVKKREKQGDGKCCRSN